MFTRGWVHREWAHTSFSYLLVVVVLLLSMWSPSSHHSLTHTRHMKGCSWVFLSRWVSFSTPAVVLTCLFSYSAKDPKKTNKKILSKYIMNIKTFLFTKPQSCQLNLINYSHIYPPTSSSTMPGEFLIKPPICFKLVLLSVHLCKIPGIMKDLSTRNLLGLI